MSPEDTHKAIRIYIGGLILGVNTLYMLFCFFKLLAVVGNELIEGGRAGPYSPIENYVQYIGRMGSKSDIATLDGYRVIPGWRSCHLGMAIDASRDGDR